ncbi:hypothetical protein D8B26_003548 [Coccidioides posadasii str. Silveira]|uniref:Uncharacterized protein n=1 Tax=Coccidioides posadasii (strain RMSCC 757 / Silveira) TaxID=443226 RepID=E9D0W5_COCPS|nr:conserved hypothetical protein [Coccidioides posadasii str. Silveira]QVM08875.1 hypothetical protein D8B26_003548 [Coccidioides posadasii str. Silveira]
MPFCIHSPSPCFFPAFLRLPPGLRTHPFSSSAARWFADSRDPTYYEILNVPITATTQEIKKQFYALSLAHHPDKNPKDPTASARFAAISDAYQVLSNASKRAVYDRDHDIHRAAATAASSSTRSGHRGSYVGSRPPSGLSKRRGPFRGPPPSFYAHGGYGTAHHNQPHNRHQQQHPHPHPHPQREHQQPHGPSASSSSSHPDPSSFIYHNTVPHFDATSHLRTQTHEDARRRERRRKAVERAKAEAAARGIDVSEDEGNITMRLITVLGILGFAWAAAVAGQHVLERPRSSAVTSSPVKHAPKRVQEH